MKDYKFKYLIGRASKVDENKYEFSIDGVCFGILVLPKSVHVYINNPYFVYKTKRGYRQALSEHTPPLLMRVLKASKSLEEFLDNFNNYDKLRFYSAVEGVKGRVKRFTKNIIKKAEEDVLKAYQGKE